jgi:membrane-associated phospholipid phosphatase
LGSDIKQEFTKPFHMTKKDWGKFGKFALVTGAMMFADETIQKNALDLRNRSKAVRNTGKFVTEFGRNYEFLALGTFAAYGVIFKSEKVKTTSLLATQAVLTGFLTEAVLKTLTGRTRPNYYPAGQEAEPTFLGPFGKTGRDAQGNRSNSSFPSGHTTAAFAAATVFAVEYRNKPLIPITAYTIASLVGISRITENKHWTTDVITGAALGYLTGRQVALNYHRYAKIQNAEARKKVTFNLQYHFGRMMPGMVYNL